MSSIRVAITSFVVAMLLALAPRPAAADKWLKVMPNDPFSDDGSFHLFDVDSGIEDNATGLVAARMTYMKPEDAASAPVATWYVWAFDCKAKKVYFVSRPADASDATDASTTATGTTVIAGWHGKPDSLKKPHMKGVTNVLGAKLCALKGSWPKADLP